MDPNLVELRKCLNVFFLNQNEDELIWRNDPGGAFSVASAYVDSFDDFEEPCWAKAWMKGLTPKVNIFFGSFCRIKLSLWIILKREGLLLLIDVFSTRMMGNQLITSPCIVLFLRRFVIKFSVY